MAQKNLDKPKFTDVEILFINNYLLDSNFKFTSQRTGIKEQQCRKLYKREHVNDELLRRRNEIAEKCDLNVEMVLNELKRCAFYDIKDHVKNVRTNVPKQIKDGKKQKEEAEHFLELRDFDEIDGRAIAEISEKIGKYGLPEIKIKAHSKMEALKVLADWFKSGEGSGNTNVQININDLKGKSASELSAEYMNALEHD